MGGLLGFFPSCFFVMGIWQLKTPSSQKALDSCFNCDKLWYSDTPFFCVLIFFKNEILVFPIGTSSGYLLKYKI